MILIATPTATDSVSSSFVATLLSVRASLQARGLASRYINAVGSDLVTNRNFLASKALEFPALTHVLFIDSDMVFEGSVVERMLGLSLPMVGCIYPKKKLDLAGVERQLTQPGRSLADAVAASSTFVFLPLDPPADVENGLVAVAGLGMGATLIRRDVLDAMIARGCAPAIRADAVYRGMNLRGAAYDFFSPLRTEGGDLLSEDFSFCRRWREVCGGEIWAVADAPIGHVGSFIYAASYARAQELRREIAGPAPPQD